MAAGSHIKHTHGSCNGRKNGTFMSSIIKNRVVLCHHFGIFAVFANHKKNENASATQPRLIHKNVLLHTSHQDFEFHSWPITFLLTSILHTPVCLVHLLLTVELEKLKQAFDSLQSISRIICSMACGDRTATF